MANTIILSRQGVSKHSYISTKKHPQNKSRATSSLTFYFSHCINSVCLLYYYYYNYYYNYYYSLGNSYNNQTLKTMLVLVSARKHTVIYTFYVQRPTLVIVTEPATWNRLQQHSSHLTVCRISRTNWKLTFSDGLLFLSFPFISNAGALELDFISPKKLMLHYYY